MERLDWREFEVLSKTFFERELSTTLLEHIPLTLPTGEKHKFDLVSSDEQTVIECKSFTWTKSGNYPSGKVAEAQRAIDLLRRCRPKQKIICFQDHVGPEGTFVEVFVRRNKHAVSGIEVWRYLESKFALYSNFPLGPEGDATAISRVVTDSILETFKTRPNSTHLMFPTGVLAESLKVNVEELGNAAVEICERLRRLGMQASFDGKHFDVQTGVLGGTERWSRRFD
jgi:hypothetical protein